MRAQQQLRKLAALPAKQKARPNLQIARVPEPVCCTLCGGVIRRFDEEIYLLHARCAPCHEALEDE